MQVDCILNQLNPIHTFTTWTPKDQECLGAQIPKFLMQFVHSPVTFSLCQNIFIITNNIVNPWSSFWLRDTKFQNHIRPKQLITTYGTLHKITWWYLKITASWIVMEHNLVDHNQHFEGTSCLHFQGSLLYSNNGSSKLLQKTGNDLPHYIASHDRRHYPSVSTEPQILHHCIWEQTAWNRLCNVTLY